MPGILACRSVVVICHNHARPCAGRCLRGAECAFRGVYLVGVLWFQYDIRPRHRCCKRHKNTSRLIGDCLHTLRLVQLLWPWGLRVFRDISSAVRVLLCVAAGRLTILS